MVEHDGAGCRMIGDAALLAWGRKADIAFSAYAWSGGLLFHGAPGGEPGAKAAATRMARLVAALDGAATGPGTPADADATVAAWMSGVEPRSGYAGAVDLRLDEAATLTVRVSGMPPGKATELVETWPMLRMLPRSKWAELLADQSVPRRYYAAAVRAWLATRLEEEPGVVVARLSLPRYEIRQWLTDPASVSWPIVGSEPLGGLGDEPAARVSLEPLHQMRGLLGRLFSGDSKPETIGRWGVKVGQFVECLDL